MNKHNDRKRRRRRLAREAVLVATLGLFASPSWAADCAPGIENCASGNDDVTVRLAAIESLGRSQPQPKIQELLSGLAGPENDESIRRAAIGALSDQAHTGSEGARDTLRVLQNDADPAIMDAARQTLENI